MSLAEFYLRVDDNLNEKAKVKQKIDKESTLYLFLKCLCRNVQTFPVLRIKNMCRNTSTEIIKGVLYVTDVETMLI